MSRFDSGTAKSMPAEEQYSDNGVVAAVKSGFQNKKVQYSLTSIAVIAACGAVGYALTKPGKRRRLSRHSDQISDFIQGTSRKSALPERLAIQIVDLVDGALKR